MVTGATGYRGDTGPIGATGPTGIFISGTTNGQIPIWNASTNSWSAAGNSLNIGSNAGVGSQSSAAIAIGSFAGNANQQSNAIAIGSNAGQASQGVSSIAIGCFAGQNNQPQNSIVLNALGTQFNGTTQSAFYAKPLREATTTSGFNLTPRLMLYDPNAGEIGYSTTATTPSKTFVINHPNKKNNYLVHACLEGPEAGVYYRGKSEITNNKSIVIQLPDYLENLATNFTIQTTHIYNGKNLTYSTSEIENNSFTVYGENGKFYWTVYGTRAFIEVEPNKTNVKVKGNGPYTWIE